MLSLNSFFLKEMSKNIFIILFSSLFASSAWCQEGDGAFLFMGLPTSAHVAALGGEATSLIDDDITLVAKNPALLSYVSPRSLNLNYMHYMQGVQVAGASYALASGERSSWALSAMYLNYGSMREMSEENVELGSFSAKDMKIGGTFSYDLSDRWSGGVALNAIYSNYAGYSSFALGVNLGLNYFREENDFSFSLTACNLGGQLTTFYDRREKLPFGLSAGISKRLAHAPLRLTLTLDELTDWDEFRPLNHLSAGVDFLPIESMYVAVGYNVRRGDELKAAGSSHWAGFTAGAGLNVKRLKLGVAYAKYHLSASSFVMNLSYVIR
jgi:long-subunit fatty acid transport protein